MQGIGINGARAVRTFDRSYVPAGSVNPGFQCGNVPRWERTIAQVRAIYLRALSMDRLDYCENSISAREVNKDTRGASYKDYYTVCFKKTTTFVFFGKPTIYGFVRSKFNFFWHS